MATNQKTYRKPVGVSMAEDETGTTSALAVCDDGSCWSFIEIGPKDGWDWHERPAIPGSRRAAQLKDRDR